MNDAKPKDSPLFIFDAGIYPSESPNLQSDLRLLKTGLLYGDRVRLISLHAYLLWVFLGRSSLTELQTLRLAIGYSKRAGFPITDAIAYEKGITLFQQLRRKQRRSRQELQAFNKLKSILAQNTNDIGKQAAQLFSEPHVAELSAAMDAGLVELHEFDSIELLADFPQEFADAVGKTLEQQNESVPLFDEETGALVAAGIRAGRFATHSSTLDGSKHIGLAQNLFSRLPSFEAATIPEILDIRAELQQPLIRFRAALFSYSAEIKELPWESGYSFEADKLFHQKVDPALLDIKEILKTRPGLRDFVTELLTLNRLGEGALVTGMVHMGLTNFNISELWLANVAAAGAPALKTTLDIWKRRGDCQKVARKHEFYFYYGVANK